MVNDTPWWVLADVCRVLELTNHKNVSAQLDEDEKGAKYDHHQRIRPIQRNPAFGRQSESLGYLITQWNSYSGRQVRK